LRQRRSDYAISQSQLASAIGVTYQQVQKYETARNRISASCLYDMAYQLQVPVGYFFDDLP